MNEWEVQEAPTTFPQLWRTSWFSGGLLTFAKMSARTARWISSVIVCVVTTFLIISIDWLDVEIVNQNYWSTWMFVITALTPHERHVDAYVDIALLVKLINLTWIWFPKVPPLVQVLWWIMNVLHGNFWKYFSVEEIDPRSPLSGEVEVVTNRKPYRTTVHWLVHKMYQERSIICSENPQWDWIFWWWRRIDEQMLWKNDAWRDTVTTFHTSSSFRFLVT